MMSIEESPSPNSEERLKALAYQLVKLYERWLEGQAALNKSLGDQEALLNVFAKRMEEFEQLQPQLRHQLRDSLYEASEKITKKATEKINEVTMARVRDTVAQLSQSVRQATDTLDSYQKELTKRFWPTLLTNVAATLVISSLLFWVLVPKPYLPLTDDMLTTYRHGQFIEAVWPKLPEKMRQSINDISIKDFNIPAPLPVSESSSPSNSEPPAGDGNQ